MDLGCKVYLNTECGHSTFSVWMGQKRHGIETNLEIAPLVKYYAKWIREEKLKVNSDWNKDLNIKFTVQDPCQQIRKSFGNPLAEDLRFVVKSVVGEKNFIDMYPNRSNNYCCGGGGGFLQSGDNNARRYYGRLKFGQIMDTEADYVITPCHNCHAQIHALAEYNGARYHTVHLWTMIALSLGVLGENEREYLGEDLLEINLPEN